MPKLTRRMATGLGGSDGHLAEQMALADWDQGGRQPLGNWLILQGPVDKVDGNTEFRSVQVSISVHVGQVPDLLTKIFYKYYIFML